MNTFQNNKFFQQVSKNISNYLKKNENYRLPIMKMKMSGENCIAQTMKMVKPFSWKDLKCHSFNFV